MNLYGRELVSIDGSQFAAVNSKGRNFSIDKLKDRIERINNHISEYLAEIENNDNDEKQADDKSNISQIISDLQSRKIKYEGMIETLKETGEKQVSLTDPDSRLMTKLNSHKMAYNVQTGVDGKNALIVDFVVSNKLDRGQMYATASKCKDTLEVEKLTTLADKGYVSLKSLTFSQKQQESDSTATEGIPYQWKYENETFSTPTVVRAQTASDPETIALGTPTLVDGLAVASDIDVSTKKKLVFKAIANESGKEVDEKNDDKGVIYGSSGYVTIDFGATDTDNFAPTKWIGTRVSITGLEITMKVENSDTYSSISSAEYPVGNTLKVEPVYNDGSSNTYNDIIWTWGGNNGIANESGAASDTYVIKQSDYSVTSTVGDESVDHTIIVKAKRKFAWQSEYTEISLPVKIVVGKMKLEIDGTTLNPTYETEGQTATPSEIGKTPADTFHYTTTGAVLDSVSNKMVTDYTVSYVEGATVEASTYSTDNDTTSTPLTGKVKLVIKATGYEDYEEDDFYVVGIPLQASLAGNISYGSLKFAINSGNYYEYEYSLDSGSTWIDVPQYEFVKTDDWSSVTSFVVRTRAKYVNDETVAYRSGDSGSFCVVGSEDSVDGATVTYTASSTIDVTYSSDNDGIRGMPTSAFNITFTAVGNLDKLSATKSGNTITITATVPTGYTINYWTIDGETVDAFNNASGSDGIVSVSDAVMTITTDNLGEGTYPVKVVCRNTNGATYDAGVSVVVSK